MSVKWTKELLEECRNERGVVLGMMSDAARDALISIGCEKREFYSGTKGWTSDPTPKTNNSIAVRLSRFYTPPELEENQFVDVPVRRSEEDVLLYRTPLGNEKQLVTASSCASFAGFVYANDDATQSVCSSVRLPSGKKGPFSEPIAVRFWKVGAK